MKAPRSLKEFLEDGRPGVFGDFLFLHHLDDNSPVLARVSLIECVFKHEGRTRIEFGRYDYDYILVKDSLEDVLSAIEEEAERRKQNDRLL